MKSRHFRFKLLVFALLITFNVSSQIDSAYFSEINIPDTRPVDSVVKLKKNTIFLEFMGNGFIYSVNYDRLFDVSKKIKMSSRIGFHFTNKFPFQYYRTISVPIEISGMYPFYGNKHFLEIGLGLTYLNSNDLYTNHTEHVIAFVPRIGYRFQKPEGGLFFKLGFTPLYDWIVLNPNLKVFHHNWFLSGGLGIGHTF